MSFVCNVQRGLFVCSASTPESAASFQKLSTVVRDVVTRISQVRPDVPAEMKVMTPQGYVGPLLALATQVVLATLNRTVPLPDELRPILSVQQNEAEIIRRTAASAAMIVQYIVQTITLFPEAPFERREVPMGNTEPAKMPESSVASSLKKMVMAGAGLGILGGLGFAAHKTYRRRRGVDDSDFMLPEEDFEDEEE